MEESPVNSDVLRLAYVESRRTLEVQLADCNALDSKAATLLAATGVVLALVGNLFRGELCETRAVAVAVLATLLIETVVALAFALWPRRWNTPPAPSGFIGMDNLPESDVLSKLHRSCVDAYKLNSAALASKSRFLKLAIVLLVADALVVALVLVIL